ncbi:hypothetical protein [Ammoniphilus sp. 3BR4]
MENRQKLNNSYLTLIETISIASIGGILFGFINCCYDLAAYHG